VITSSAGAARGMLAAAALACCAAAVAGCGTAGTTAPPAPTVTVTASPPGGASPASTTPATATPTPSGPPPCATSALHISVPVGSGNAAAGSSYYPIEFANVSGASCTLYGYPGVSFVTGIAGSQIGIAATENSAVTRQLITLAPGQTGHAELQVVDALNYPAADCGLVTAHWLKIYPPNQTAPVYVSFTARACSKPKTILTVQTVQSGAS
jgi:hypothetical protein